MAKKLDTTALLVEELVVGVPYQCTLAGNRKVQYIGNNQIKWYSSLNDEYKIAEVHDYQLIPMDFSKAQ